MPYYMDALNYLQEAREKGKMKQLGLTNFDTRHLEEITDKGVTIASNQARTR